jgi:hypothetical protein
VLPICLTLPHAAMVGGRKASSSTEDEVAEMPDRESSVPHAASFVTALATDAFEPDHCMTRFWH